MTDYTKLRDAEADAACLNSTPETKHHVDAAFKAGFDAATAHWLEQVRELVEALESVEWITQYPDGSPDHCRADRAKVDHALAKWAELTEGVRDGKAE